MQVILLIISFSMIAIVLLQSGKAESTGSITGGNDNLFSDRKERGGELFMSRLTLLLGVSLFVVCIAMNVFK